MARFIISCYFNYLKVLKMQELAKKAFEVQCLKKFMNMFNLFCSLKCINFYQRNLEKRRS